jgi:3-hydroxymyristoyl/3-hydroxydecanoyl-(acyl carrier protein) dehydratase
MGENPDHHFAAFSFVDRIDEFVPRTRARGRFTVPAGIGAFPACLVAEAVGQLAAWISMEAVDFRGRPVAALAGETRFLGEVVPGSVLELAADMERCDEETVAYTGSAAVGGRRVIELLDCFAPLLPAGEFDAPEALRGRLAVIRGAGAAPGRFGGVPRFELAPVSAVPGESRTAMLQVPDDAPFFADHFPRRPVFPATLLLDAGIRLALQLATEIPGCPAGVAPRLTTMTRVKVRSFTPPGQRLQLAVNVQQRTAEGATLALAVTADDKSVATARVGIAVPAEEKSQ